MKKKTTTLAERILRAPSAHGIAKYSSLAAAERSTALATKPQRIFLGDDGKFWVSGGRTAGELKKMGYETA